MSTSEIFNCLQLGIEPIDKQNRFMVILFNKVLDHFNGNSSNNEIQALDELIAFADYKFSSEERWMEKSSYHKWKEHMQEHTWILNRIIELKKEASKKNSELNVEVMNFLQGRLQEHIRTSDARYGLYVAAKGTPPGVI